MNMQKVNYKDLSFRMSNKKMADVMYAILMTNAKIIGSSHMGWKDTRKQNGYNLAEVRIEIKPHMELEFEEHSGCKLETIEQIGGAAAY